MYKFEKPDYKITEYVDDKYFGKFILEPLERGFGITIGNSLRRVMLSSLPGDAISTVYIDGVSHEFQKIDGVVEDVASIILNLKSVVIKKHTEGNKVLYLTSDKEGVVTAGDITPDSEIEIVNPNQVICTLAKGGKINMELTVSSGKGYVRGDENKIRFANSKVGTIAIDSLYSPIELVIANVEPARVGQDSNYDKLILEVTTNGAISPERAIALASEILKEHLNILTNLDDIKDFTGFMSAKTEDPRQKILETPIDDLDLSVRAFNCLKRANVNNLQDLVNKSENEMMKIRNLGKKSLKEVIDKVKDMGLDFREDD